MTASIRFFDTLSRETSIRCSLKMVKAGRSVASKMVVAWTMSPMSRSAWRLGNPVVRSYANQASPTAEDRKAAASTTLVATSARGRPVKVRATSAAARSWNLRNACWIGIRRRCMATWNRNAKRRSRIDLSRVATEPLDYPSLAAPGARLRAQGPGGGSGLRAQGPGKNLRPPNRRSCLSPEP